MAINRNTDWLSPMNSFADNVGIFKDEMAEYFDHVRESGEYLSQNFSSKLEYRNNIYDAVEISIKN